MSSFSLLTSVPSLSSLPSLTLSALSFLTDGSPLCWAIRAMGLTLSSAALGRWLRSRVRAAAQEIRSSSCVDAMANEEASEPASLDLLPPAPAAKKKVKKSVAFALERNTTRPVDKWFVDTWGRWEPPRIRNVHFSQEEHWILVSKWLQPDGHNQLHFPRTKWIRDVPDWDVEDVDGDIDMLDS